MQLRKEKKKITTPKVGYKHFGAVESAVYYFLNFILVSYYLNSFND